MLSTQINKSNIIEMVRHDTEQDEEEVDYAVFTATVRVLQEKYWVQMMVDLLREAAGQEGFDLETRKAFWWDEEASAAKFSWILVIWGDLALAEAAVGDILARRFKPKPTPTAGRGPQKKKGIARSLRHRRVRGEDGTVRVVTTARLPHAKAGRYETDPHKIVPVTSAHRGGKPKAAVSAGSTFRPRKMQQTPSDMGDS